MVLQTPLTPPSGIYTRSFLLLCASSLLFSISFNMIIPELPAYLTSLGGEDYKGLIIALFALTAGLSRPFSGKLADTWGRIPVMIFGTLVCVIAGVIYSFLGTVFSFLLLRFFHGLSTGFKPTGLSAYVADIVPPSRRGEAMGIIGMANSLGIAGGPVLGQEIMPFLPSLDALFYLSALVALFSILILLRMPETVREKQPFRWSVLRLRRSEVLEPRVFPAAFVMMLSVFSFGIVLTIVPDFSLHLELENKGSFFGFFIIGSIGVRILAGKLSDRFGRAFILMFSTAGLMLTSLYTATVSSVFEFYLAAIFFGVAVGFNSPTLFAWAVDLSVEKFRGRAMATLYIALEIGIATGALVAGWLYNESMTGIRQVFLVNAALCGLACVYSIYWWRRKESRRTTLS